MNKTPPPPTPAAQPEPTTPAPAAAPVRRRRRRFLPKLAAVFVVLLITFAVCELAARLIFPAPPDPAREPQIQYVYSNEIGYLHLPDQQGWIDDGLVTINRLGFRGPEPAIPKSPGLFRLLVVGSSNTVGWGVQDEQTFCANLERTLPATLPGRQIEVLNWAVSGYKMEHKEQLLRRYAVGMQPDLLLLDFSDYDLFATEETPRVGTAADATSATITATEPVTLPHNGQTFQLLNAPSWLNRTLRKSRALYCAKNGLHALQVMLGSPEPRAANEQALVEGRQTPEIDEAWHRVEESLARIHRATEHLRGRVGLLIFPVRGQVGKDHPNTQYQDRLKTVAAKFGFFVIDPLPRFQEQPRRLNELFIPYDRGHSGPLGHQLIAEAVLEAVRERCGAAGCPSKR